MEKKKNYKILHIGNSVNNAYNAAKFDRKNGWQAYVAAPNNNHVMTFPFWEEEELEIDPEKEFDIDNLIQGYQNPNWFLYGSWNQIAANYFKKGISDDFQKINSKKGFLSKYLRSFYLKKFRIEKSNTNNSRKMSSFEVFLAENKIRIKLFLRNYISYSIVPRYRHFLCSKRKIKDFLNSFDILIFYGNATSYANLLKGEKKYIALENGTLRHFVWGRFKLCKLVKKGFQKASLVFITNSDCYESAIKLGLSKEKLIRTSHPKNEVGFKEFRQIRLNLIENDIIPNRILLPARHIYSNSLDIGKGNEVILQAVFEYIRISNDIKFTFIEWGADLSFSKKLIEDFGGSSNVEWIKLQSRVALRKIMVDSIAILDQVNVFAYGGITEDALGLGVPVITASNSNLDYEHFSEVSPVLKATNKDEILFWLNFLSCEKKKNTAFFRKKFEHSTQWYDRYISNYIEGSLRLHIYENFNND